MEKCVEKPVIMGNGVIWINHNGFCGHNSQVFYKSVVEYFPVDIPKARALYKPQVENG